MKRSLLSFPVLIGDIGGTNARFSMLYDDGREEQIFPTKTVADFATIDDAITFGILPLAQKKPASLLLAMAGPVEGDVIPLTNSHWVIAPKKLIAELNLLEVMVINDFEAQALATTALESDYLIPIGNGKAVKEGSRAILGPGTGLGVAGLVYVDGRYVPVAGEGGHVDFSLRTERDLQLMPYLHKIDGRISAEEILSGRGLLSIYRAICAADGVTPHFETPNAITVAAHRDDESQAYEAAQFFIRSLARVAGDFALIFLAHGGVYIGGGIIPKMMKLIDEKEFRAAFEDKAPHNKILKAMSVSIMTHPRSALVGMAAYAHHSNRFIINTSNRLWKK